MFIQLSNASEKPIYEQITAQLKQAILSGKLLPGDALPSIRALAKDLKISVMTTKRAYADLERDGFIETVAGKGSFVAERNQDFLREELLRQLEAHLLKAVQTAKTANMSKQELLELFMLLTEEEIE
ncbi:GntR family transcriptional regulator [Solibacillus sp. FSL H8-0538]|uniref:GntR family transcriptional regulator n=1 Tax=Solibacillus sp. FSL H8-0538 TaxID=2921400 RepID=UPI0030FBAE0C